MATAGARPRAQEIAHEQAQAELAQLEARLAELARTMADVEGREEAAKAAYVETIHTHGSMAPETAPAREAWLPLYAERGRLADEQKVATERLAQVKTNLRNPYYGLPKILFVEGIDDAGEYGAARCPHCGAEGRYIYTFVCDDGHHYGAMRGCFRKFPLHPFAEKAAKILEKERELGRFNQRHYSERKLASWDLATMEAIEAYAAGTMSEGDAWERIRLADADKKRWMRSRGYAR